MIWVIIIISAIILDQGTKYLVVKNIDLGGLITVIDKFFYLTYTRNKGAAWSILQNGRYFFIVMTAIVSVALVYFLRKADHVLLKVSLSMILGGALGNWIDRVFRGSVVDFFEVHIGPNYIFPIFNVADSFVVVGTILLAVYLLFIYKEKDNNKVAE